MSRFVRWIRRFTEELRRRKVIRVAVVYGTTGFVALQVADILVPALQFPPWTLRLVTVLLILGFPLAVGLAWAYNLTEEGVVEAGEDALESGSGGSTFTSNGLIIGLLAVAIGLLLYPRVFSSGEELGSLIARSDTLFQLKGLPFQIVFHLGPERKVKQATLRTPVGVPPFTRSSPGTRVQRSSGCLPGGTAAQSSRRSTRLPSRTVSL